ncbi:MAG TPA: CDP-diacylglycerol--glycerol-3-phosphate 3-phosphatidyltransferase [Alphaproteobacteria bacterium]|nr:CDP-diacylglycerol--glycerol-3-phosphate 3-phosphatidyltransferase [Alphaproteobacteria bacterium]
MSQANASLLSLPNVLTLSRVVMIPLLVAAFFLPRPAANWTALAIFAAASITDFFDGYVARRRAQYSDFGRFLDPLADKLLVAAAIVMLAAVHRLPGLVILPAIVILLREFVVSGLREFLAGISIGVPVSRLAKWKTTVQMVALGFLIVGDAAPAAVPAQAIGEVALWVAAALTIVTGYAYLRAGIGHIVATDAAGRPAAPAERPGQPRPAG